MYKIQACTNTDFKYCYAHIRNFIPFRAILQLLKHAMIRLLNDRPLTHEYTRPVVNVLVTALL
jgi:hypothetical protein